MSSSSRVFVDSVLACMPIFNAHDMKLTFIFLDNAGLFSDEAKLVHSWKTGTLQFTEFTTPHKRAVKGSHNTSTVTSLSFFSAKLPPAGSGSEEGTSGTF